MTSIGTQMTQILKLFRAAENNNIGELYELLTENPYLLHGGAAIFWGENPLHLACKRGSVQFVEEVIKINPLLARGRNNYGFTPMHVAAASGHTEIVKALAVFDSRLCLTEDLDSRIPLHVAAIKGKKDVVRALISSCPESLRKTTSDKETAFHLSLKYCESGVFKVLMEELKTYKLEELLKWKDYKGDTVLHIATSHKLIKILELLLIPKNSNDAPLVDVNSMNERGYTPLDVHNEAASNNKISRDIRLILLDAGAVIGRPSSPCKSPIKRSSKLPIKVINLLLMVFIMAATLLLAATCNPPTGFKSPRGENITVYIWDMVIGPSDFQVIFYYMIFSMVGFLVSMGFIFVLLWPLPYRMVTTFVLVILVVIYILVVGINMPKFRVIMGSFCISSGVFMMLSALIFILIGITTAILVKAFGCFHCKGAFEKSACGDLLV